MADLVDTELAACFDLMKVSLGKTDQTKSKADAFRSMVRSAVEHAHALQSQHLVGDPAEIAKAVQVTLRFMAGNLLVPGDHQQSASGLAVKPYISLTKKYSQSSGERNASETLSDADSLAGRPSHITPAASQECLQVAAQTLANCRALL